jgi:hypothetical protein
MSTKREYDLITGFLHVVPKYSEIGELKERSVLDYIIEKKLKNPNDEFSKYDMNMILTKLDPLLDFFYKDDTIIPDTIKFENKIFKSDDDWYVSKYYTENIYELPDNIKNIIDDYCKNAVIKRKKMGDNFPWLEKNKNSSSKNIKICEYIYNIMDEYEINLENHIKYDEESVVELIKKMKIDYYIYDDNYSYNDLPVKVKKNIIKYLLVNDISS